MKVKVKFHFAPCYEEVLGSGVVTPRIINLGARWRWVVSLTF